MLILRIFPVIGRVSLRMGGAASRPFDRSPSLGRRLSLGVSPHGRSGGYHGLVLGDPPMTWLIKALIVGVFVGISLVPVRLGAQSVKFQANPEWDKLVDAAKKEGKVAVSIPASAEMRKQLAETFKRRFGIEIELFTARGSAAVRRMADEFKAGLRHFDLHIEGSS